MRDSAAPLTHTRPSKSFSPTEQRAHAGVILVYGVDHSEFALIVRGIQRRLELRPDQADWRHLPAVLDRRFVDG